MVLKTIVKVYATYDLYTEITGQERILSSYTFPFVSSATIRVMWIYVSQNLIYSQNENTPSAKKDPLLQHSGCSIASRLRQKYIYFQNIFHFTYNIISSSSPVTLQPKLGLGLFNLPSSNISVLCRPSPILAFQHPLSIPVNCVYPSSSGTCKYSSPFYVSKVPWVLFLPSSSFATVRYSARVRRFFLSNFPFKRIQLFVSSSVISLCLVHNQEREVF